VQTIFPFLFPPPLRPNSSHYFEINSSIKKTKINQVCEKGYLLDLYPSERVPWVLVSGVTALRCPADGGNDLIQLAKHIRGRLAVRALHGRRGRRGVPEDHDAEAGLPEGGPGGQQGAHQHVQDAALVPRGGGGGRGEGGGPAPTDAIRWATTPELCFAPNPAPPQVRDWGAALGRTLDMVRARCPHTRCVPSN